MRIGFSAEDLGGVPFAGWDRRQRRGYDAMAREAEEAGLGLTAYIGEVTDEGTVVEAVNLSPSPSLHC